MPDALLAAALLACVVGMGWLALAMDAHGRQVWGQRAGTGTARALRMLGVLALGIALGLCLAVDHASMAVLVWVMGLSLGALLVAMVLAWQARWLGLLAPWVGRGT